MKPLLGLYSGTIDKVLAPSDPENVSKYQYEYRVLVTCDLYSQLPARCVSIDPYGSFNAYQDTVFGVGHRVFVMFPRGDRVVGIILGGSRYYGVAADPDLGTRVQRRFNELVETFGSDGAWSIESDDGPLVSVGKQSILLDDASGESILIDKKNKKILVNCNDWDLEVAGSCVINVKGAATVKAASADVQIEGDASVKAGKVSVESKGDVSVKASGNAKVDAASIELNGSAGQVVTTATHPTDYVTGAPIMGVGKVKAG